MGRFTTDMNSLQIAALILLILSCAGASGVWLGRRLRPEHVSSETRTLVSASMAIVGTMTALVISLLISSSNTSFLGAPGKPAGPRRQHRNPGRLLAALRRRGRPGPSRAAALFRGEDGEPVRSDRYRDAGWSRPRGRGPARGGGLDPRVAPRRRASALAGRPGAAAGRGAWEPPTAASPRTASPPCRCRSWAWS